MPSSRPYRRHPVRWDHLWLALGGCRQLCNVDRLASFRIRIAGSSLVVSACPLRSFQCVCWWVHATSPTWRCNTLEHPHRLPPLVDSHLPPYILAVYALEQLLRAVHTAAPMPLKMACAGGVDAFYRVLTCACGTSSVAFHGVTY